MLKGPTGAPGTEGATMAGMSDAQYATLSRVDARDSTVALRYFDTRTVTTLIAMAKRTRGWVTLVHGIVEGRRQITSAVITNAGRHALAYERARREQAAEQQRVLDIVLGNAPADAGIVVTGGTRPTLAQRVDPFALVATGAPREVEIPF